MSITVADLDTSLHLLQSEASSARADSMTVGQLEAAITLFDVGPNTLGLWRCTEGEFPSSRVDRDEVFLVLSGRATIVSSDGSRELVHAGSVVALPDGWAGKWIVESEIVKLYMNLPRQAPRKAGAQR